MLLVAGSSFSNTKRDTPFKKWPELLSEKLNLKLLDVSKNGASNLYIYDSVMSNLDNDVELVIAAWSYGLKTTLFNINEINLINKHDNDGPYEQQMNLITNSIDLTKDEVVVALKQSMRLICYLDEYCRHKGKQIIHYPLLNIFKTGLDERSHLEVLDALVTDKYFNKITQMPNIIGWPSDLRLGGHTFSTKYRDYTISSTDRHPNEQGNLLIANEIYDKYMELQGI